MHLCGSLFVIFLIFQQYFFREMLPASTLRGCKMPGKCSSELKLTGICPLGLNYWFWNYSSWPAPIAIFTVIWSFTNPCKKSLDVFQSDLKTRIIWVFQQTFEEIRFLNRCVRAKKKSSPVARPHCINWWFPDLPRKSFRWYLDVYFENYAEMDSTHQELYFLLLLASQLSKRSSGGLGEVKKL